jgi:transposase-like protein
MASQATWAKRVEEWRASGVSAQEFARRIGVSANSLRHWAWRLKSRAEPTGRSGTSRERSAAMSTVQGTPVSPLTFVEMTAAIQGAPLELVLVNGVRVRVPPEFDASALARILDVVERRR